MGIPGKKEGFEREAESHAQQGLSFEDVARLQNVWPIVDSCDLLGGWPGDVNDGFEEAVSAWRLPPAL